MKSSRYRIFFLILISILTIMLIAGCPVNLGILDSKLVGDSATGDNGLQGVDRPVDTSVVIPADVVNDTLRIVGNDFDFKTLLPVELKLDVDLYEVITNTDGSKTLKQLDESGNGVVAILKNGKGDVVYTGLIQDDGTLDVTIQLPAAPEDCLLILTSDRYEERQISIRNMVNYSKIDRVLSLLEKSSFSPKSLTLTDRDGDTVPDVYDAYPDDPDRAFDNPLPAKGYLTVAFEDLFGHAQAGDADYNDFIAKYKINQITNSKNEVVRLEGEAVSVAKIAGYNHLFGIYIDYFNGTGTLTIDGVTSRVDGSADIVLFPYTGVSVGQVKEFSIDFDTPQAFADIQEPPYNPYLYVYNTGHDIHLIGAKALPGSINPDDDFRDADGFPWALLVPVDWIHPDETQRIEIPYPRFTLWRESLGTEHTDWYLHYYDPYVPEAKVYVGGYYAGASNDVAAYWVDDSSGLVNLYDSGNARVKSIQVVNGNVYAAGYYESGGERHACYWKNGVITYLSNGNYSEANGIYVYNGSIYVAGYYNDGTKNIGCYWKDGVRTDLLLGSPSYAYDIFYSGTSLYIVGNYRSGSNDVAYQWIDGTVADLTGGSNTYAYGLYVDGSDIYVSGTSWNPAPSAFYWKNGSPQTALSANISFGEDVFVSGGNVYVTGYYKNADLKEVACYWKNDSAGVVDLYNSTTDNAEAHSIYINGNDIYVSGFYNSGSTNIACYWKNGARTDLYSGGNSDAYSIFVE